MGLFFIFSIWYNVDIYMILIHKILREISIADKIYLRLHEKGHYFF